jgi:hypothetical protein
LNCLECHSSAAKKVTSGDAINAYDKASVMLSINCERCHGPSKEHIDHHTLNPGEKEGQFIVNPASIATREIRMDVCAVCHSGIRQHKRPPFSFKPGMSLKDHSVGLPSATTQTHLMFMATNTDYLLQVNATSRLLKWIVPVATMYIARR